MFLSFIKEHQLKILILVLICCGIIIYRFIKLPSIRGNIKTLKTPIIIFDFDGTICDSFSLCLEIYNKIANGYGFKKAEQKDIKKLRSLPPFEILKALEIPKWKLPFLARRIRKEMKSQICNSKPFEGIKNILGFLKTNNASIVLLTSNSYKNVNIFFDKHNMNFFDVIYTGVSTFGKSKVLKSFLNKINLSSENNKIFYIGDEVRDIEACKKAGIPIISVTWGLNNHEILNKHTPNHICNNYNELNSLLKKIVCP